MGVSYLGQNLHDLRTARRLSQFALAQQAGPPFSQSYVSRLERGLMPSDPAHVAVLAALLGVSRRRLLQRPRHGAPTRALPFRHRRTTATIRDTRPANAGPQPAA